MKVFISVPMENKTDEEIKKEIAIVENIAKAYFPEENALGTLEFVDGFLDDSEVKISIFGSSNKPKNKEGKALYCLGEALQKMSNCDAVISPQFRGDITGCYIETYAASHYGVKVYEYDNSIFDKLYNVVSIKDVGPFTTLCSK